MSHEPPALRIMTTRLLPGSHVMYHLYACTLHPAPCTLSQVMYRLYARTRDPDHLSMARQFDKKAFYAPMVAGRDILAGHHANTHLAQAVGFAERAEAAADTEAATATANFFEMVTGPHAYATGGSNDKEFWFEPGKLGEAVVAVRARNKSGPVRTADPAVTFLPPGA